jgi:hypothetical protein
MHFARSIVIILAALAIGPAVAGDCRVGTNRPMSDAVEQKAAGPGKPRIVCQEATIETRGRDGSVGRLPTWRFDLKK